MTRSAVATAIAGAPLVTALALSSVLVAPPARGQQGDVRDLPLIEAVAARPSRTFAVFLSGDGGWANLDRTVTASLQASGVSVVGINSLKYFWRTRTPDGAAADFARVIRFYAAAWKGDTIVAIGYSRGAGIVPFLVTRLPGDLRSRVGLVVLIGAEHTAGFKFHVMDLFKKGPDRGELPVMPEIEKLGTTRLLCFYGVDETDTLCPELHAPQTAVKAGRGHHFGGDYGAIGDRIAAELRRRKP